MYYVLLYVYNEKIKKKKRPALDIKLNEVDFLLLIKSWHLLLLSNVIIIIIITDCIVVHTWGGYTVK